MFILVCLHQHQMTNYCRIISKKKIQNLFSSNKLFVSWSSEKERCHLITTGIAWCVYFYTTVYRKLPDEIETYLTFYSCWNKPRALDFMCSLRNIRLPPTSASVSAGMKAQDARLILIVKKKDCLVNCSLNFKAKYFQVSPSLL